VWDAGNAQSAMQNQTAGFRHRRSREDMTRKQWARSGRRTSFASSP
jgi:hypothetical protein